MADDPLERKRRNPAGDWTIADIERLCRQYNIGCWPPSGGGAHFKISHDRIMEILTIPARRPIKQKYIRLLVKVVALVLTSSSRA